MKTGDSARFDAALLAGGRSQRMGDAGSKALLPWPPPQGPPLLRSQLEKLTQLTHPCGELLVSCHTDQAEPISAAVGELDASVRLVHDSETDRGPLGGLAACLKSAAADYLLVVAVDLPQLPGILLDRLMATALNQDRGVVVQRDGRWEPLVAIYPTELADEAARRLAAGELALQAFVDWAAAKEKIVAWPVADSDSAAFDNINTPADYATAASAGGSAGLRIARHQREKEKPWHRRDDYDEVASEEPLELRVEGRSVAVVMRTPGHDEELAAGFLVTEGVAKCREDFFEISQCPSVEGSDLDSDPDTRGNVIDVLLGGAAKNRSLDQLTRHVFTSSSCGICGKATIESVFQSFPKLGADSENAPAAAPHLERDLLLDLPERLRRAQQNFRRTGGLHASALFDATNGDLLLVREDVGRHNALDKVVGYAMLNDLVPLANAVLLLSGRISFELMQKALAAGIPIVAGLSAPSSLAVKFARDSGQTLVGFLRERSFNVYAGERRLSDADDSSRNDST